MDNVEKEVKQIDNNALDSILGRKKNLPQIPNSQPKTLTQNVVGSNKEINQKLFEQKRFKKSDFPFMNISKKITKWFDITICLLYNWIMYVIIKHVKTQDRRKLPVIILDTQGEVWEFDNKDKAQEMVNIFNTNTDSGHIYEVKQV